MRGPTGCPAPLPAASRVRACPASLAQEPRTRACVNPGECRPRSPGALLPCLRPAERLRACVRAPAVARCGVLPSACGAVAGAGPPGELQERAKGAQQGAPGHPHVRRGELVSSVGRGGAGWPQARSPPPLPPSPSPVLLRPKKHQSRSHVAPHSVLEPQPYLWSTSPKTLWPKPGPWA